MLINGKSLSWANITIDILGARPVGVTSIKYELKQEKTNNYGIGTKPVSRGRGKKEYSGSIKFEQKEVEAIIAALPAGRDLTDIAPFNITVAFSENGLLIQYHTLKNCEFMNDPFEASSGDTSIEQDIELIIGDIVKR